METPPRSPAPMAAYLRRYELQQRERRLERQLRRVDQPEAVAQDLSGFLSDHQQEEGGAGRYEDALSTGQLVEDEQRGGDDEFAFAELHGGSLGEQQHQQEDEDDEEFVDAATFLARDDRDSFLQDEDVTEWKSEHGSGRPSDFFQRKSRSLERVDFALNEYEDVKPSNPPVNKYDEPPTLHLDGDPHGKGRDGGKISPRGVDALLSESQATAVSSSNDIHFDSTRLAYTPNSLKYLQDKQRNKSRQILESSIDSVDDYTGEAIKISQNTSRQRTENESVDESEDSISTLCRGPAVIRSALNEIDSLLDQSRRRSVPTPRSRRALITPREFQDMVREYEINQDTGLPMSRTTDSWGDEASEEQARETQQLPGFAVPRDLDTIREVPSYRDEDSKEPVLNHQASLTKEAVRFKVRNTKESNSNTLVKSLQNNNARVAMDPRRLSRRCRRLLCNVGDVVTEQIIFSNGTDSMGRLCVSLLPLSTGCQQFSVAPAVLELAPQTSGAFHVTFNAKQGGVAAGIFQFRGVGIESLFRPYEVLMEASVRRTAEIEDRSAKLATSRNVEELRDSVSIKDVDIGPTFIQFESKTNAEGGLDVRQSKIRIVNNTAEALPFKVKCAHENLKIHPTSGVVTPASEVFVACIPVSQPFQPDKSGESTLTPPAMDKWCGSLSIQVGEHHTREVSVVVSADMLSKLPLFEKVARSRHNISSQTDSFYYTKRRNRRGLYFHARAVEFGSCLVGNSHEVPVYICNGSNQPMTVFMQDLQEPFSCAYSTTTIQPRKFIEVPVRFTPKVVGKVSTSLFAYSVDQKAVLTMVARGI